MLTSRPGRSSNGCPKRRHGQAWREAEEEMEETKPGSSSSNGKPALLLPTTTTTVEGAEVHITDPKIMPFLRAFFADAPIDDQTVDSFVECHQACGSQLDSLVFGSPARHAFPAKRRSHRELCKRLISKFEQLGLEPSDILYEHLCRTLAEESEQSHFYRIFPLVDFHRHRQLHRSDYIVCQEAVHQISQGTTGLSCWQASFVLADFLLLLLRANSHFSPAAAANCCILELGAGCGLAGIALAKQLAKNAAAANDEPKLRVVLTDLCHPVLDQLHANVRLNFGTFIGGDGGGGTGTRVDTGTHVEVQRLDWTDYEADQLPPADLIIAADIVYDPALFPALVGLLRKLLSAAGAAAVSAADSSSMQMQQPICLLACTVRDPATVEAFLRCAAQHGIKASAHWEHRFFGGSSTAESKKSQKHSFVRLDVHDDDDEDERKLQKMGTIIEFEPIFSHAQPVAHFPTQIFEFSMKAHC